MPTETTAQRLIDANAFIANLEKAEKEIRKWELPKRYLAGLVSCIAYAKSAPTVETTDGVMKRLPKNFRYTFETKSDTFEVWTRDSDSERTLKLGYWKTPLEAVTRLEAALRA